MVLFELDLVQIKKPLVDETGALFGFNAVWLNFVNPTIGFAYNNPTDVNMRPNIDKISKLVLLHEKIFLIQWWGLFTTRPA